MMDRIIVTAADIEKLLAWRDEHKELVRSMPVPLREVKIQIVESGISISTVQLGSSDTLSSLRLATACGRRK